MATSRLRLLALLALAVLASDVRAATPTKPVQYNWRKSSGSEMTVAWGTRLAFNWAKGPKTGVVQMPFPGLCVNGSPAKTQLGHGVSVRGDTKGLRSEGKVVVSFRAPGAYFFTSPAKGACDARWLRVNVNPPVGR